MIEKAKKIQIGLKVTSKLLFEQHLGKHCVLDRLWSSIPLSHEGKLEAAWLSHPGDGDV